MHARKHLVGIKIMLGGQRYFLQVDSENSNRGNRPNHSLKTLRSRCRQQDVFPVPSGLPVIRQRTRSLNPDSRPQEYRAHAVMDQALVDLSNNCRRPSFLKGLLQKVECHGGHRGYTGFDRGRIEWREERRMQAGQGHTGIPALRQLLRIRCTKPIHNARNFAVKSKPANILACHNGPGLFHVIRAKRRNCSLAQPFGHGIIVHRHRPGTQHGDNWQAVRRNSVGLSQPFCGPAYVCNDLILHVLRIGAKR